MCSWNRAEPTPAGTVTLFAWMGSHVSGTSAMMFVLAAGSRGMPTPQAASENQNTSAKPLRFVACPPSNRYLPP